MFDSEFYPTPKEVIQQMLAPFGVYSTFKKSLILEPSAGKGDILDYIRENGGRSKKLYCIEKNKELTFILQEKNYKVIGNDFLQYNGNYYFDLIIMNPPFSNGDAHLLHAWNILKSGDIVCLLNEETIKNPYTKTRKLLASIIEENGSIEYLGDCFSTAERKTDVRVAMVRLKKEAKDDDFGYFQTLNKSKKINFDDVDLSNKISRADVIEDKVQCFNSSVEHLKDYLLAKKRLQFSLNQLIYSSHSKNVDSIFDLKYISEITQDIFNEMIDNLKKSAWQEILSQSKISTLFTEGMRKNFDKFSNTQGAMDFTKDNINDLFEMLFLNKESIMQTALLDVFDTLTKYDKNNKVHIEGWKTNDAYKVNRKVIIPDVVGLNSFHGGFSNYFGYREGTISDLDKVMCFISGKKLENITTIKKGLLDGFDKYKKTKQNTCESEFFEIKFFKKGTIHLTFKDEFLWAKFNQIAAEGKNWLPK